MFRTMFRTCLFRTMSGANIASNALEAVMLRDCGVTCGAGANSETFAWYLLAGGNFLSGLKVLYTPTLG